MKSFIPSRSVKNHRVLAKSAMTDRAAIYREPNPATAERKPSGAIKDSYPDDWTLVRANAPCKINYPQRRSAERMGAGKVQATEEPYADFEHNQEIDEKCRFRMTACPDNSLLVGIDFDVTAAPFESTPITRRVEISRTTK